MQPVAFDYRPSRTQPLLLNLQHDVRDAQAPTPSISSGRLLRLTCSRRSLPHPWHPGARPILHHGQLPRRPVAPRVSLNGSVGLSLLLLQAHTGVHEPPTAPTASHARIHARQRAPAVQTISPKRSMARYDTPPLHGRHYVLG
jgi:hypothetical protein